MINTAEIITAPSAAILLVIRIPEVKSFMRLITLETKLVFISTGIDAARMLVFVRIHEGELEEDTGAHRPILLWNGALLCSAKEATSCELAAKVTAIATVAAQKRMVEIYSSRKLQSDWLVPFFLQEILTMLFYISTSYY